LSGFRLPVTTDQRLLYFPAFNFRHWLAWARLALSGFLPKDIIVADFYLSTKENLLIFTVCKTVSVLQLAQMVLHAAGIV